MKIASKNQICKSVVKFRNKNHQNSLRSSYFMVVELYFISMTATYCYLVYCVLVVVDIFFFFEFDFSEPHSHQTYIIRYLKTEYQLNQSTFEPKTFQVCISNFALERHICRANAMKPSQHKSGGGGKNPRIPVGKQYLNAPFVIVAVLRSL